MSSKKPSLSPELEPIKAENNTLTNRRQFIASTLSTATLLASGCSMLAKKPVFPKDLNAVDENLKDKLLEKLGVSYDAEQRDGSYVSFSLGDYVDAKKEAIENNKKALGKADRYDNKTENEFLGTNSDGDDVYLVAVKTYKVEVREPLKTYEPNPNLNYNKEPTETIPAVPEKPVETEKSPNSELTTAGGFKERVARRIQTNKFEISHLYNRYIVKAFTRQNKKAPEDSFTISLKVTEDGKVRKIDLSGMSRSLTKLRFDRIIKNYAKRWRYPRNPEASSYEVRIPVTLESEDIKPEK